MRGRLLLAVLVLLFGVGLGGRLLLALAIRIREQADGVRRLLVSSAPRARAVPPSLSGRGPAAREPRGDPVAVQPEAGGPSANGERREDAPPETSPWHPDPEPFVRLGMKELYSRTSGPVVVLPLGMPLGEYRSMLLRDPRGCLAEGPAVFAARTAERNRAQPNALADGRFAVFSYSVGVGIESMVGTARASYFLSLAEPDLVSLLLAKAGVRRRDVSSEALDALRKIAADFRLEELRLEYRLWEATAGNASATATALLRDVGALLLDGSGAGCVIQRGTDPEVDAALAEIERVDQQAAEAVRRAFP